MGLLRVFWKHLGWFGSFRVFLGLEPPFPEVETLSGMHVISMACGGHHSAAISERWQLFTWGGGAFGKLGHGNRLAKTKPTKVQVSAKLVQVRRARGRHAGDEGSRADPSGAMGPKRLERLSTTLRGRAVRRRSTPAGCYACK